MIKIGELGLSGYRSLWRIALDYVCTGLVDGTTEKLGNVLLMSSAERTKELERREQARSGEGNRWFIPEEAALIDALASVIVPSDDDTPGAREVDVLGAPVTETLSSWIADASDKQLKYSRGLVAFDELATRIYGSRFVCLRLGEQLELLKLVDGLCRDRSKPSSLVGKLKKRLVTLLQMWNGSLPAIDLFPMVVGDVHAAFYTSEVSWIWLGYDGPPMPHGYSDLYKPRLSTREKALRDLEAAPSISVPSKKQIVDVIVIGSGAGGGVVAKELGEAGLSVLVLEAGKRFNPSTDYPTYKQD